MKQKKKKFLKEFLKERKEVGAVAPSSKYLCRKICNPIDFENTSVIVELGPGTGVVTRELISNMKEGTKLFIFETNESFYHTLKEELKAHENIHLFNTSAENIVREIENYDIQPEGVDAVVSSLPLAVIPKEIVHAIIENSKFALKKGGKYIQFQYSLNALKLLKSEFTEVKINFTPMNVPPAFVYTCVK